MHKNQIENQAEIDRLVREPNAYPELVENKDNLQDNYIKVHPISVFINLAYMTHYLLHHLFLYAILSAKQP